MLVKRYIHKNNVSKNIIYTKTMLVKRYIQTMLVKRYIQTNNVGKTVYTNTQC